MSTLTPRPVDAGVRIGHVHLKVANLERVAAFLRSVNVATLHLVPYQRGYLHKYRELGLPARCAEVVPPGRDHLRELATRLAQRGISAVIDA